MRGWITRRWPDVAVLVAALGLCAAALSWRGGQWQDYGLTGRYFPSRNFTGTPFATRVDPFIDLDKEGEDPRNQALYKRGVFSVEWSGSVVLPRHGRYAFATESDDGSELFIDGKLVVNNSGVHGKRLRQGVLVLPPGPHAIRVRYFQGGGGGSMRVYWKPDRRGEWETIAPTLLFPRPPDRVRTSEAHAVPPRDLPAALVLHLALALVLLVWARRPLLGWLRALRRQPQARIDLLLALVLLAGALTMRLWDLSAAGQTWDEDIYWTAARNYADNLLAGDLRAVSWHWNLEHPAMGKWVYAASTLVQDSFLPARVWTAILGALTCMLMFLVGRDLLDRRVGFIGAALCVVLPHIVGHHKIIGLETPTALFYLLTVWLTFRALKRGGNSPLWLLAAITAAMVISTRVSNLSVLFVVLGSYLIHSWPHIRKERAFPVPLNLGLCVVVLPLTFILIWPYLWENPMGHLGKMLSHWKPDIFLEYFLGKRQEPPRYYFPLYLLVTTPVALLPLLLAGQVRALVRRGLGPLTVLLWFLGPWIVMFSPMARDGVRYLYPALFPAALLAAFGADWIARGVARLVRRPQVAAPALAVLGIAAGLQTFAAGLQVHPYYIDYYNELTGGPKTVARKRLFEIAWWGEGLKEAAAFISRTAPARATVKIYAHPTHVVRLRPDLRLVNSLNADYVIYNNLFNDRVSLPQHRVVYVVRAAGAPLVWVYAKGAQGQPVSHLGGGIDQRLDRASPSKGASQ